MSFQLRALSLPLQILMSQLCAMKAITTMPYLSFQSFWQHVHHSCKIWAFLFDNFLNIYMELVVNPFRYYGTCYDFASFVNNIVYAKIFKNSKIHSWRLNLYIFDMSWICPCIIDVFPKIEKVLQLMDVHLVMSVDIWNVGLQACECVGLVL